MHLLETEQVHILVNIQAHIQAAVCIVELIWDNINFVL